MKRFSKLVLSSFALLAFGFTSCGGSGGSDGPDYKHNNKLVEAVSLSTENESCSIGDSLTIFSDIKFKDDVEVEVSKKWMNSKPSVATMTISEDYESVDVNIVGSGTTYITFIAGYKNAVCEIYVPSVDPTPGPTPDPGPGPTPGTTTITLSPSSRTLSIGEVFNLSATVSPLADAEFASSDTDIVVINNFTATACTVEAKAAGEADVVVTAGDGVAKCHVTVLGSGQEGDKDYTVYFFIDYNNADTKDTTKTKLLAKFDWYYDRPLIEAKDELGKSLIPEVSNDQAMDPAFPYFIGWSTHPIIDTKENLWDLNKNTIADLPMMSYSVSLYGQWFDVPVLPAQEVTYMKKKLYVFALALLGMTLTACGGNGSVGLDYDDSDLDIDTEWVDYSVPVTKVKFDSGEDSIKVARGETHEYSYSVEPAKASKKSLSWSSANEAVATVKEGVVKGVEAGKTIITVSNKENSFDQINLNVEVIVPVTNISFNDTTLLADFNHTYILDIIYTPFDTTQKEVTWHSSDESIATVDDNGNLTTKDVAGSVSITVTSAYINKVIELNVEVADRTIYPDAVNIDEYENEVEVGKNFTMKASAVVSSDPSVMPTHPEVKYYSSNPEVLYVEEDSGIVHALGVGNTTIYATAMGKNGPISSETKTVSVFEVKVQSIILSDISLTNRDGRSDIAIPLEYTTDKAGYPVASIPKFVYEVADTSVATVTEAGKLFAVAQVGTTTLTVSETRSGVTKTVNLSVGYEVDSVSISGSSEVNVGSTTKLNVSTIPSGVPSEYVTFSSDDTNIATVSETGVVSGVSAGSTTITATVLGVSETISITVSVPEIPFAYDMTYIVGDKDYSSGESKPSSTGSWDRANQAKAIDEVVQQPHDTLLYERRAIVQFNDGDIW